MKNGGRGGWSDALESPELSAESPSTIGQVKESGALLASFQSTGAPMMRGGRAEAVDM